MFAAAAVFCLAATASAQDGSGFALSIDPAVRFPLPRTKSAERYQMGYRASVNADYVLPEIPWLFFGGAFDVGMTPYLSQNLTSLGFCAGPGLRVRVLPPIALSGWGRIGYGIDTLGTSPATNPYLRAGMDLALYLTPSFRIVAGGEYVHQFAASAPFYQGIAVRLSAGINFSQINPKPRLELREGTLAPVFPVFYKYYDSAPLGSIKIRNDENGPATNVKVSLFVRQYMDAPKESAVIQTLKKGEEREVPLYALFNRSILSTLEATKAQAEVMVEYTYAGNKRETKTALTAQVNHRNAMTWSDDRRVAAFATMNEPSVMRLSKQVAGLVRGSGWQTIDTQLRQALGIFEALGLYGMRYVVDPNTPYTELEKKEEAIDYLQFPAQSLEFRAGDCDDLSILTVALFEAAGIETAFITVPGHIYIAFALAMDADTAQAFFSRKEDMIVMNGKAWVPVEITAVQDGFNRAWQLGARQWRDASTQNKAALYPTHDAWKIYQPVALSSGDAQFEAPKSDRLIARYNAAMTVLIERELSGRVERIAAEMGGKKGDPKAFNKLGVLYARFGLFDKAESGFRDSLKAGPNVSAWNNLGNVMTLRGDYKGASDAYQNAYKIGKASSSMTGVASALAGLIKTSIELNDEPTAKRWLGELAQKDPAAAGRFAYVESGTGGPSRAGTAEETVGWEE